MLESWCRRADSNRQPIAYEAIALPLSYCGVASVVAKKPPAVEAVRPVLSVRPRESGDPGLRTAAPGIPACAGMNGREICLSTRRALSPFVPAKAGTQGWSWRL